MKVETKIARASLSGKTSAKADKARKSANLFAANEAIQSRVVLSWQAVAKKEKRKLEREIQRKEAKLNRASFK